MIIDKNNVFKLEDNLLKSNCFGEGVSVTFTTNLMGYSNNEFKSNNFALHLGDNNEDVMKNRNKLAKQLNCKLENFVFAKQTHGVGIEKITKNHLGKGVFSFEDGINDIDCLYTYEKNIALACFYADCTPIFFYDETKKLVGIIHAGWQGTVKNIVEHVINHLVKIEKVNPQNLKFIIGPNIKKESFEVEKNVYDLFVNNKYFTEDVIYESKNPKWKIDIVRYITNSIIQNMVPKENIYISSVDTFKEKDLFSFRRENKTGRMLGVIKQ